MILEVHLLARLPQRAERASFRT